MNEWVWIQWASEWSLVTHTTIDMLTNSTQHIDQCLYTKRSISQFTTKNFYEYSRREKNYGDDAQWASVRCRQQYQIPVCNICK